ncbi:hypothetical protein, partial [Allofournierella massiliensis]|uniref:hypothetical protein n=1 Tax=Allofournierella massiliensis TaxID=1650663 RepID=UPI0024B195EE
FGEVYLIFFILGYFATAPFFFVPALIAAKKLQMILQKPGVFVQTGRNCRAIAAKRCGNPVKKS